MADLPEETKSIKTEEVDGAKVSSQGTTESHEDNKVYVNCLFSPQIIVLY